MAFGGGLEDNQEVMSEINMTPLVDVMLVLLIIFIITVPVLTHSVNIDLPQADTQPNEVTPETLTLTVTEHGEIHWDEKTITHEQLREKLAIVATQDPQPNIQLRGASKVEYQYVVKVMSDVQKAGIEKLGFVTEPEQ